MFAAGFLIHTNFSGDYKEGSGHAAFFQRRCRIFIQVLIPIIERDDDGFPGGRLLAGAVIEVILQADRLVAVGLEHIQLFFKLLGGKVVFIGDIHAHLMVSQDGDVDIVGRSRAGRRRGGLRICNVSGKTTYH